MEIYRYKARDKSGKLIQGTMEAISQKELIDKLRKLGLVVTGISIDTGFTLGELFTNLKRVNQHKVILFNIQLAKLVNSGMTLLSSLKMLSAQLGDKNLRRIIEEVSRDIETGSSFSGALSRHPKVFNNFFCSMVRAGEETGKLDIVLNRLSDFQEHQLELTQSVRTSLIYPTILVLLSTAIIIFIVTSIIPSFVEMFRSASLRLPTITIMLYEFGKFLMRFWYIILFIAVFFTIIIKVYIKTEKGSYNLDSLLLSFPYFGGLFRRLYVSRFARTLSMLISSGIPILQSLIIVEEVVTNKIIAKTIRDARESVAKGSRIHEPLKISREFPQEAVQMISIGEESGELEAMLEKIADLYDTLISYNLKRLVSLLEPFFLLVMGGIVIVIMASVLLPLFDMVKVLRR